MKPFILLLQKKKKEEVICGLKICEDSAQAYLYYGKDTVSWVL